MADINLKGMGVALITPFKEDESVDYEALGKLVDYGRRKEKHYKLGSDSCTGPYPYRIRRGR